MQEFGGGKDTSIMAAEWTTFGIQMLARCKQQSQRLLKGLGIGEAVNVMRADGSIKEVCDFDTSAMGVLGRRALIKLLENIDLPTTLYVGRDQSLKKSG